MKGSVFKRCPHGITGGSPTRPRACKESHGSWSYVLDVGRDPYTGKRRQEKASGFRTQDEAQAAVSKVSDRIRSGTHALDRGMTVATFLEEWLEAKVAAGLRPTTERSYRAHIRDHLGPHLGHLRLRDLRHAHIQAMLRAVSKGRGGKPGPGAASVRRVHATLRSALTSAVRQQLVVFNPAATIELPAAPRPKVRPWEPAELGKFLDHVAGDRLGALFETIAMTGMRRGEACGLRWSDLDMTRGRLVVRQQLVQVPNGRPCGCGDTHRGIAFGPPKTASGDARTVDLDSGTTGVLLGHRLSQDTERLTWGEAYRDHGLVFAREDGSPLALDAVTKRFVELAREAGLRPVRLHDLRHGAASLRLAAGVPLAVVSKSLGHSSSSFTADVYSHLLEGVGREAAESAAALVPRARTAVTNR